MLAIVLPLMSQRLASCGISVAGAKSPVALWVGGGDTRFITIIVNVAYGKTSA